MTNSFVGVLANRTVWMSSEVTQGIEGIIIAK